MQSDIVALFLVTIAIAVLGFAVLGYFIRRDGQAAIRRLARAPVWVEPGVLAARTHLVRIGPVGDDEALATIGQPLEGWVQELRRLGFEDVGRFQKQEKPEDEMCVLVHREHAVYAMVHQQPEFRLFVELVSDYEDGSVFGLLNLDPLPQLERPPGWVVHYLARASAEEMYRRMLAERPAGALRPATVEGFVGDYERGYAHYRDWQILRGGLTADELRAVVAWRKEPAPNDEQMAAMLEGQKAQTLLAIKEVFEARLCESWEGTEQDLYRARSALNVIHDRLPIEAVLVPFRMSLAEAESRLAAVAKPGVHDDWLDGTRLIPLAKWPPRRAFRALNELRPEAQRAQHLATFSEFEGAIEADCYGPPRRRLTTAGIVTTVIIVAFYAGICYIIYDVLIHRLK